MSSGNRSQTPPAAQLSPAGPSTSSPVEEYAPYPGSHQMPRWDVGPLAEPPKFQWTWKQLGMFLGPGLVMGASAIGGGEWLTGPLNTARYGGAILWLATLSILGQTLYNIEISRYTLYTGEPIFTGKFRSLPGPLLWLWIYLVLDFGSFFPYLAANAAVPLATVLIGGVPETGSSVPMTFLGSSRMIEVKLLIQILSCLIFLGALVPLLFGGKVYNSLKAVMSFKLIVVIGFLSFLALFYSDASTWGEIFSGFFRIGTVPVVDPANPAATENIFTSVASGRGFPQLDFATVGFLAAMAAIAGNGGLTNTPISNFTRDQGWGMGREVGAIPSIIGGHTIHLSHVGKVFRLTSETLTRWKGWVRHISRDQLLIWMPACFIGIALPSMLSVQFLPRGTVLGPNDGWKAAVMTAGGVQEAVGGWGGGLCWYLTLLCGFLVLSTSMVSTADGVLRRWVDVFWTALPWLRKMDTRAIGPLYFGVLCVYCIWGLAWLTIIPNPAQLLKISTNIYNYALGFSCFHVIAINTFLLPRELRPTILRRCVLGGAGVFFLVIAGLSTYAMRDELKAAFRSVMGFVTGS